MSLRIDVRINSQADGRLLADSAGDFVQGHHLILGFDVKHQNSRLERVLDLVLLLADSREHNLLRIGSRSQSAKQFPTRYDIEAAALFGEDPQQRDV